MEIGLGLAFQNLSDQVSDADVYRHELSMAERAEDLGYDSIWTPEHHFTGYMMTPNVPQFLAWVAAKTKRIKLGTTVTVLPWHSPVRVAETFIHLDHLSEGRAILGIGRGLGKKEFDGFGIPMGESRDRFTEYAEALLTALETGVMEFDGKYLKQPRVELRPRPYRSFKGRVYASAVSPQSIEVMARLEVGLMIIAQKPWHRISEDLAGYREQYHSAGGRQAPRPVLAVFAGVSENPDMCRRMREEYLLNYAQETSQFYEFGNPQYGNINGYEYYGGLAKIIEKHGINGFNKFLADLQFWGTPEEVTEKMQAMINQFDIGGLIVYSQFGGMPHEVGRANFELFARKVLPNLKDAYIDNGQLRSANAVI